MRASTSYFSGHPVTGAPLPCQCGGKGVCVVCQSTQDARFAALKQQAGEGDTVGDFFANSTLDKPFKVGGARQIPYVRMVGRALGLPAMENAKPGDLSDPITTRCTNLGGMLASALKQMPPEKRQQALDDIGGLAWTQDVLRVASALNGKLPATEAIHFALTVAFMRGAADVKLGKPSASADAYSAALRLAQAAEQEGRAQSLGITRRGGSFQGFGRTGRGQPGAGLGPLPLTPVSDTLNPGEALTPASPDGKARWMAVSKDGRFVLFITTTGVYLVMRVNRPPIASQEQVTPEQLMSEGNADKSVLWLAKNYPATLPSGVSGKPFSVYMDPNGALRLLGQRSNGTVETYETLPASLATRPDQIIIPRANSKLVVQGDGNVVAYAPDGRAIWELGTYKQALRFFQSSFVAPPDIAAVDRKAIDIIDCEFLLSGALALYGNNESIPGVKDAINKKIAGIRIAFQRVFGRAPNNAEVTYFGRLRWCVDADGLVKGQTSTLERKMEEVRAALLAGTISNTAGKTPADLDKKPRASISDATIKAISDGADWAADILCEGFTALLGPEVGGVLCAIFRALITAVGTQVATTVGILSALAEGILGFIQAFASNEPDFLKKTANAFMALLKAMTKAIFFAAAPLVVGVLFAAKGAGPGAIADGFKELEFLANRVSQKDPLFPLTVTLSVITFILIPIPTPANIAGVVTACLPLAVALIAKGLLELRLPLLASYAIDAIEEGVDRFLKLCIMVVTGFLALKDLVSQVMERLQDAIFYGGTGAFLSTTVEGKGGKIEDKSPMAIAAEIVNRLVKALDPANPRSITKAISRLDFNLKDIGSTVIGLLTLIPAIIIALAGPAIDADPSLSRAIDKWYAIANSIPGEIARQQPQIMKDVRVLWGLLENAQRRDSISEAERTLDLINAGKVAARILWERAGRAAVTQANRDIFFTSVRAEWTAQGGAL